MFFPSGGLTAFSTTRAIGTTQRSYSRTALGSIRADFKTRYINHHGRMPATSKYEARRMINPAERHFEILGTGGADVFVNVVGGVRVDEPGCDLAVALAVASASRGLPLHASPVRQSASVPRSCAGRPHRGRRTRRLRSAALKPF